MQTRPARTEDAERVSQMLYRLEARQKRTLPSDPAYVRDHYITHADRVQCTLAVGQGGEILGLQILKRAAEGNAYGVTPGWGIIGTHVCPDAARQGIGRALFAETRQAAREAGLRFIDATIGQDNAEGLGYYAALGFQTYRTSADRICKRYQVD